MKTTVAIPAMPKLFYIVILILIGFSVLTVYVTIPSEGHFMKDADEGYYFKYVNAVMEGGIKNIFYLSNALWKAHFDIGYSEYAVLFCSGPWYRYAVD